jgi:hypothetical protein
VRFKIYDCLAHFGQIFVQIVDLLDLGSNGCDMIYEPLTDVWGGSDLSVHRAIRPSQIMQREAINFVPNEIVQFMLEFAPS